MKKLTFIILSILLFTLYACDEESNENESKISHFNDDESHNFGENCMICHVSGGDGEGWFKIAGSIYATDNINPLPNASVLFYSQANGAGDLIQTVEVDAKGNFYTTEDINFGTGLYPVITNNSGTSKYMMSSVTSGACSACHGNSTGVLNLN